MLLLAAVVSGVVWLRGNTGAERAEGAVAGSTRVIALSYDGVTRDYRLFVPGHLAARAHPLLVAIHQLHGSAVGFERRTRLDAGAEQRGVVVVYPDGLGHSWNAGTCCQPAAGQSVDDVGFLTAVIADVSRRVHIDSHRVAVTGFSNGRTTAPEAVEVLGQNLNPAGIKMSSSSVSNLIKLDVKGIKSADIWLSPKLLDFKSRPDVRVNVRVNGRNYISGRKALIKLDLESMLDDLRVRGDKEQIYWHRISVQ